MTFFATFWYSYMLKVLMGFFMIAINFLSVKPIAANLYPKFVAGIFALILQRSITFRVSDRGLIREQAFRYLLALGINILIASGVLVVMLYWIALPVVAKLATYVLCVVISFALGKYFVFPSIDPNANS
jgi:putative flippase GtrA